MQQRQLLALLALLALLHAAAAAGGAEQPPPCGLLASSVDSGQPAAGATPGVCPAQQQACSACGAAQVDVLLAAGARAHPPNGLWLLPGFRAGVASLPPPRLLCSYGPQAALQLADVAVAGSGAVLALDSLGRLHHMPQAALARLQAAPAAAANASAQAAAAPRCPATLLVDLGRAAGPAAYSGLAPSPTRSDVLHVSTNANELVSVQLAEHANGTVAVVAVARVYAAHDPVAAPGSRYGPGGADLTPGPDGWLYRVTGNDSKVHHGTAFVAARLGVARGSGLVDGRVGRVNRGITSRGRSHDGAFSLAGAWCTRDGVFAAVVYEAAKQAPALLDGLGNAGYVLQLSEQPSASLDRLPPLRAVAALRGDPAAAAVPSGIRFVGAATRPLCGAQLQLQLQAGSRMQTSLPELALPEPPRHRQHHHHRHHAVRQHWQPADAGGAGHASQEEGEERRL